MSFLNHVTFSKHCNKGAINVHENRKYLSVPLDTLIDSVEFCESLVGKVFPACSKLQIGKLEN